MCVGAQLTSHVYPQSRLSGPRLRLSCDVASKQNLWGGYMETMVMGVSLCVWWALGLIGPRSTCQYRVLRVRVNMTLMSACMKFV